MRFASFSLSLSLSGCSPFPGTTVTNSVHNMNNKEREKGREDLQSRSAGTAPKRTEAALYARLAFRFVRPTNRNYSSTFSIDKSVLFKRRGGRTASLEFCPTWALRSVYVRESVRLASFILPENRKKNAG